MFSVWRKLTGKQDEKPIFPSGVLPIGESMQKKYAKGIQYNMKIIIKGDRNSGKSMLFKRLNGGSFTSEYIPTHEIQVSNVNWNYQGAVDVVKVEVWDIVDKSDKKRASTGNALKIVNDDKAMEEDHSESDIALDAEFLNVYKGTHGVILTMDITKAWTWQYVQRELEKIPHRIPVLVLGNFRDMGEHRVVQTDEILAHIQHFERPTGSAEIYFTESSMKDGFGLHFIYKFLNMPFLILQRETLLKQLEANALEIEEFRETLSINIYSDDLNYSNFKEMLSKKDECSTSHDKSEGDVNPSTIKSEDGGIDNTAGTLQPLPPLAKLEISNKNLPVATVSPTVHSLDVNKDTKFQTYKKMIFGGSKSNNKDDDPLSDIQSDINQEMGLDANELTSQFLKEKKEKKVEIAKVLNDSDDEVDGNPMVANYEDLDIDEGVKGLEHQFSNEGEFEDLSDDERPTLAEADVSIIEKIKSERLSSEVVRKSENREYNNLDIEKEGNDIDTNFDEIIGDNNKEIDIADSKKTNKLCARDTLSSDDENADNVIVIAQDIDVDDSWISVDSDNEKETKSFKQDSHENSEPADEYLSNPSSSPTLNIEIDDLELFMQSQLKKTSQDEKTIPEVANTSTSAGTSMGTSTGSKKKKKKKKAEDSSVSPEKEKRRKKKASSVDAETPEKSSTRKVKNNISTSEETSERKSKSSKKTRKKENSISELDSFYSGL